RLTRTGPSAGTAWSSVSLVQTSSTAPLSLKSGIDALLERLKADAPVGVDEPLALGAVLEVGRDQGVDGFHDLVGRDGRTEDGAERGVAEVDVAAQAQLVELDAVLVDAQDADVANMMMAAGVDAARDLDLEIADVVLPGNLGEMLRDALRYRD